MISLFDAHGHYHDARLRAHRAEFLPQLVSIGLGGAVVNGTRESDWPAVTEFCSAHPGMIPSFGLHPWFVRERSSGWREALVRALREHPPAVVGEVGLDRWVEGHDLEDQKVVLAEELVIANELDRPVTIHCLRAWGALQEMLRLGPAPSRGFLLHAYGGPLELVAEFAKAGAYFSFSPYFLHERKGEQRRVFAEIPMDRLLVETDAPDLWPPPERNAHPLVDELGATLNHPANLAVAYSGLAEIRGLPLESLAARVAENFRRLFLG